jgi:hypothetical protein
MSAVFLYSINRKKNIISKTEMSRAILVHKARNIAINYRTVETARTCHRDFLGAHRYTTRGGMCVLRRLLQRAVVCQGQTKGETRLPLRFATLHYPFNAEQVLIK